MGFSSAFPRLLTQPHNVSWVGSPRVVPVLLPHINTMGPLRWRHNVDMWRHPADFVGTSQRENMEGEPTKNLRPRYYHKVFGMVWALWQRWQKDRVLLGFWFEVWKGADIQYPAIDWQLLAVHTVRLLVQPLTKEQNIIVRTSHPTKGWDKIMSHHPIPAITQTPTFTKSQAYV